MLPLTCTWLFTLHFPASLRNGIHYIKGDSYLDGSL